MFGIIGLICVLLTFLSLGVTILCIIVPKSPTPKMISCGTFFAGAAIVLFFIGFVLITLSSSKVLV